MGKSSSLALSSNFDNKNSNYATKVLSGVNGYSLTDFVTTQYKLGYLDVTLNTPTIIKRVEITNNQVIITVVVILTF